jgi:hypothetical protein
MCGLLWMEVSCAMCMYMIQLIIGSAKENNTREEEKRKCDEGNDFK